VSAHTPPEKILFASSKSPKWSAIFSVITQSAFVSLQQRVVQNISMSAEERYVAFKSKYPKMELRIPQRLIASYLGISAEFLSKIKSRLAQKDKV